MRLFGLVALGFMWARIAKAAGERKALGNGVGARMDSKLMTGRFFMERMLPETGSLATRVAAGSETVMSIPAEMF
jgi:acyl-CoA dehydrogenase